MSKQDLIAALSAQRDALVEFWDAVSEEQRGTVLTPEGWRLQDFVGHLSFWEQFILDCLRDTAKNGRPTPLTGDASDEDLNGRAAARRRDWSWQRVRAEFVNTRNALIERIGAMDESDLRFYIPSPWVNDDRLITIETMLRQDVLAHGAEHDQALKAQLAG